MILPSYRAYRVWQRNRDVYFRLWLSETLPMLVEPLFVLVAMGFGLGAYVALAGGQSYLEFLAPGLIASYAMFSATFECTYGSYVRMELQKTFDAIIATPLSIEDVIAGEILWAGTRSAMTAGAVLVVIAALGLVGQPWAPLAIVVAGLEGLMFGSFAMLFTSVTPSINGFSYYFTLFITPMFFAGDIFFPLSGLPEVVQRIAWFVPLTHMARLSRGLVNGPMGWDLVWHGAWVLGITAIVFLVSLATMRRRLIK
ncbi:MAG: ABC transporter permease [Chloroflexi bacterium]|nr:ABC transporter permease [Chloroflexota bacterium]